MLQHAGEKPFACKECNFSCRRPSRLKYHTLVRNLLLARNANTHAGSPVIWKRIWKTYIYEASTPGKWSISVILTLLCYDLRGEGDNEEKLFAEAQQRKYVPSLTQQAPVTPPPLATTTTKNGGRWEWWQRSPFHLSVDDDDDDDDDTRNIYLRNEYL